VYAALARSRTVFYTPVVKGNHKDFLNDLENLTERVDICIDQHLERGLVARNRPFAHVDLIVVDEADRLPATSLEHLRDRFDRRRLGLLLIGMPGLENDLPSTPSCTAGSASPTSTGRSPTTNWPSCSPGTGSAWA
jgi:Rad3-related DNA helicase